MITYDQFKDTLKRLIGSRFYTEQDNMIKIVAHSSEDWVICEILETDLIAAYEKVSALPNDGLELVNDKRYEIAVDTDMMRRRKMDDDALCIEDNVNSINYRIGVASFEYYILYIIRLAEALEEIKDSRLLLRFRKPVEIMLRHRYMDSDKQEKMDFVVFLDYMFDFQTLVINSSSVKDSNEFRALRTSYQFEYMYRTGLSLIEYTDILTLCRYNENGLSGKSHSEMDVPPYRKYVADVVDYYKLALSSMDSYIQYISYYHVIEYFYDEVFKRKLVEELRFKITSPSFSYRNDDQLYSIAKFVKNRLKMNDEAGQGNEKESLKFVLEEYVDIDELKNRIYTINPSLPEYYQNNKVAFCNASAIGWKDAKGCLSNIAARIYSTRNSLVHSKSGKNEERYRPYRDERALRMEIPLIQAVAELIIIKSSVVI